MNATRAVARRLPIGVDVVPGGVHVRAWAPGHRSVEFILLGGSDAANSHRSSAARDGAASVPEEPIRTITLEPEGEGFAAALIEGVGAGDRYWLRVDGGRPLPDPASRFQPIGPHGPSQVVDPSSFAWTDGRWKGPELGPGAIYELHVGAFTREGTFEAAQRHLPHLRYLGVGIVELMPLAEFPGRFGWGYDGVDLYAPTHLYGQPDDLRRFVDAAHGHGLGVILDVVYNHLGPDGAYLREFASAYMSRRHRTDWGDTFNFDDEGSQAVREFVIANARYWVDEFHMDGLRLDATQQIFDTSDDHVLAAIGRAVREAGGTRRTVVVVENEPQETRLVRDPQDGGLGLDALWNDDLHHSAMVALTGHAEAYYSDYRGSAQELVSAARIGFLFQGQPYAWQKKTRGTPSIDLAPGKFVSFIQNHDQVANSAHGERIHQLTSPGRLRAMTAYLLLGPETPMLFMGQEFAASSPFLFFADHQGELARNVAAGRRAFLAQFPSLRDPAAQSRLADPASLGTFEQSRLDQAERGSATGAAWLALHTDLLALRRRDPAFANLPPGALDGAVLSEGAFLLRYFPDRQRRGRSLVERLLIVNLGPSLDLTPAPQPLLAPPEGGRWELELSTDDVRYGGPGVTHPESETGWRLPAEAAVLFTAVAAAAT